MFSLKRDETISKTIRIPVKLVEKLEKLADEKGLSLSKVIIQCCEYALENLEDK